MSEGEQKKRAVSNQVVYLLRTMEISEHVGIERVILLERWQKCNDSRCRDPRPAVLEFGNPSHMNRLLASADSIRTITGGEITIQLDDAATSKILVKDAKVGSPGFSTAQLQVP